MQSFLRRMIQISGMQYHYCYILLATWRSTRFGKQWKVRHHLKENKNVKFVFILVMEMLFADDLFRKFSVDSVVCQSIMCFMLPSFRNKWCLHVSFSNTKQCVPVLLGTENVKHLILTVPAHKLKPICCCAHFCW